MKPKINYLFYKGVKYLLSEWITVSAIAKLEKKPSSYYRKLIFNARNGIGQKSIEFIDIKEIGLTLVKKEPSRK